MIAMVTLTKFSDAAAPHLPPTLLLHHKSMSLTEKINTIGDNTLDLMSPFTLMSTKRDPNTLSLFQAKKEANCNKFVEAM